jgi:3-(3-hydroxy-phenyl)propionate hydroxylase
VRPGGLIANPLVSIRADVPIGNGASAGEGAPVRLDAVLRGRMAVLTAGQPTAELVDLCRRHRLLLVKVSDSAGAAPGAGAPTADGWAEVCLDGGGAACFQALTGGPGLTIIVRPDRVIAAVATRGRLPRLPWSVPAAPVPRASQMIPHPAT